MSIIWFEERVELEGGIHSTNKNNVGWIDQTSKASKHTRESKRERNDESDKKIK